MSEAWIDGISRHFARPRSRRSLIRTLVAAALGAVTPLGLPPLQSDAQSECGFGESLCSGGFRGDVCVDTDSDADNCGQCGTVCPGTSRCRGGECECTFGSELCPSNYFPDDLVCVDTDSDADNCGQCGTVCQSGLRCQNGVCTDDHVLPATPGPVPFDVDTIADPALTEDQFADVLPRSFPGYELVTGLTAAETSEPLYEGVEKSRWFFYVDPRDPNSDAFANANVSTLPAKLLVMEVLTEDRQLCEGLIGCFVLDQDLSQAASVLFQHQSYPAEDVTARVHYLAWGARDEKLVYALFANSAATLKALATALVVNARNATQP